MSDKLKKYVKFKDNMLINGIDENFYNNIRNTILKAKINIYKNINYEIGKSSGNVGRQIIEEEKKQIETNTILDKNTDK